MSKYTIHGIDLMAPGGVQELLAFHRCQFGSAKMMADAGTDTGGNDDSQDQGTDPADAGDQGTDQGTDPADADNTDDDKGGSEIWDDPVKAKAEIERLRRDAASANGKARENARAQAAKEAREQLIQDLGKTLGLVEDDNDKAPDVNALTEQVKAERAEANQAKIELAVFRAAGQHNADANALLDSRSFLATLEGIDPTDTDKVSDAIKAAVADNPKLKSHQVAGKGGAEFGGGAGEGRRKAGSLSEALQNHYQSN